MNHSPTCGRKLCWRYQALSLAICWFLFHAPTLAADHFSNDELKTDQRTSVVYNVRIVGSISTPGENGSQTFPLKSNGEFQFHNHQIPSEESGISAFRAHRNFVKAFTHTVVDEERETNVSLPTAYGKIQTCGHDGQLKSWHPKYALLRKQSDLLRMPFDVMIVQALLPVGEVADSDTWNAASWVVPALTGLDATVSQSVKCSLTSLSTSEAHVDVSGNIEGAISGSASKVHFDGSFTFDRISGVIRQAKFTMKEKRTAGPISPGIDVTAEIEWSQNLVALTPADVEAIQDPSKQQLMLSASAPGGLRFRHSRNWHLFHQTGNVMMLRLLQSGELIGQANFSEAATVQPGEHTPDAEFDSDIQTSVSELKGQVLKGDTKTDVNGWRIRHIPATGSAGGKSIIWDYYLCSSTSGKQYSVVFSHATEDSEEFEGHAERILATLVEPKRRRPKLPFR